jgi:hypothetical protein
MDREFGVPIYIEEPFVKVFGGVGTFFQKGSDKKEKSNLKTGRKLCSYDPRKDFESCQSILNC